MSSAASRFRARARVLSVFQAGTLPEYLTGKPSTPGGSRTEPCLSTGS